MEVFQEQQYPRIGMIDVIEIVSRIIIRIIKKHISDKYFLSSFCGI